MIYLGKTGEFMVFYDKIFGPVCVRAEQADDYITDLAKALEMMHRQQDKLLEEKGAMP